ncbi:helix-turn-helix domain-containing protein, partial [Akkermansiaceae bacterium]|nr:helix-turn-helix domain-containing protein [Akkermansiaceae bacterium]
MNEKYHRLCAEDRKVIYNMNQADFGQAEIAQAIGFSQPTISKELRRNKGKRGYRHKQAGELAKARQKKKGRAKVITGVVKEQVDARILVKHSPDQISKKLKLQNIHVSHESIYQYILAGRVSGGFLWRRLRITGTRRYRRRNKVGRGEKIKGRVDI